MDDCVFCKIVKGEIPCYKIYENKDVLAFLDIENDVPGHTLVIPKKHLSDLDACDDDVFAKVLLASKKIVKHFLSLGYEGVNLVSNCKESSGQIVKHFHVHIFPRKTNDGAKLTMQPAKQKTSLELMAEKLRFED